MLHRIESFVEQYHMIEQGEIVITGVSGGADSVCLLLVLLDLQQIIPFTIEVVHIEHGIRGEESKKDADFVHKLCVEKGVPFKQFSYAVKDYATEHGLSVEEAGRNLRYESFHKAAANRQNVKIAVAHNQNDLAETLLLNLIRGSSTKGLTGIPPVRGKVIRPLLQVSRQEIEDYLQEKQQAYCVDATNLTLDYARNKIRHQVLPVLTQVNPKALLHMEQAAGDIRQMEQYLAKKTEEAVGKYVTKVQQTLCIAQNAAEELDAILFSRVLHKCICEVAGSSKDIGRVHIEAIEELFDAQVGKEISLPYGLRAKRTYEGISIGQLVQADKEEKDALLLEESCDFSIRIFERTSQELDFPKKKYTKWIDYDRIKGSLFVRARQSGDFFMLDDNGSSQKLKQYFVNEKIPQGMRNKIPLVADGSHIVWVVGYRMSAFYKVSNNTKRILEIRFDGGQENE